MQLLKYLDLGTQYFDKSIKFIFLKGTAIIVKFKYSHKTLFAFLVCPTCQIN